VAVVVTGTPAWAAPDHATRGGALSLSSPGNLSDYRFSSGDEVVEIGALPDGGTLRLRSGNQGIFIKDSDRVALLGGPFDSEVAARAAASALCANVTETAAG
jgi:hypothetical protein